MPSSLLMPAEVTLKTTEDVQDRRSAVLGRRWDWIKRIGAVGGAQTLIQGIGFLAGILVVRSLSMQQYALFTLANTMLGTMNVLGDGGISSGVMAQGGNVWTDRVRLGGVVATGLKLRRQFAGWSLAISIPVLVYLLRSHQASWLETAALVAVVSLSFSYVLLGSVYNVAPSLHQRLAETQRIGLVQNTGRLAGLAALVLAWPYAVTALLPSLASQAWASIQLKHLSSELADATRPVDPKVKTAVLSVVKRMLPACIYFCISGQTTLWLISLLGNTTSLAQVGALSRLGQAFTVLSSVTTIMIVPRFARLPQKPGLVLRRYFQVLLVLAVAGAGILALVVAYPGQTLWVLGRDYSGLTSEVKLLASGSVISLLAGTAFGLGNARGWVIHPVVGIGAEILWQVLWICLLDVSKVQGVLWLGIAMSAFQVILFSANVVIWARRSGE